MITKWKMRGGHARARDARVTSEKKEKGNYFSVETILE